MAGKSIDELLKDETFLGLVRDNGLDLNTIIPGEGGELIVFAESHSPKIGDSISKVIDYLSSNGYDFAGFENFYGFGNVLERRDDDISRLFGDVVLEPIPEIGFEGGSVLDMPEMSEGYRKFLSQKDNVKCSGIDDKSLFLDTLAKSAYINALATLGINLSMQQIKKNEKGFSVLPSKHYLDVKNKLATLKSRFKNLPCFHTDLCSYMVATGSFGKVSFEEYKGLSKEYQQLTGEEPHVNLENETQYSSYMKFIKDKYDAFIKNHNEQKIHKRNEEMADNVKILMEDSISKKGVAVIGWAHEFGNANVHKGMPTQQEVENNRYFTEKLPYKILVIRGLDGR